MPKKYCCKCEHKEECSKKEYVGRGCRCREFAANKAYIVQREESLILKHKKRR